MDLSTRKQKSPSTPSSASKRKNTSIQASISSPVVSRAGKSPFFARGDSHGSSIDDEDAFELDVVQESPSNRGRKGKKNGAMRGHFRGTSALISAHSLSPISLESLTPFGARHVALASSAAPCSYRVISTNKAPEPVDTLNQSIEVDRFTFRRPGFENALLISRFEDILTVGDAWRRSAAKHGSTRCMGMRQMDARAKNLHASKDHHDKQFSWFTYAQIDTRVRHLCNAMNHLAFPRGNYGIWSENRVEWYLASLALSQMRHRVCVPVHFDPHHALNATHVVNHSEMHTIFVSRRSFHHLLEVIHEAPNLRTIICFDDLTEKQKEMIRDKKIIFDCITIHTLTHLEVMGKEHAPEELDGTAWERQRADDINSIYYTSGTQGDAKGVLLTNINIVSAASALQLAWSEKINLEESSQVYLSYLPLDQIAERCNTQLMLDTGCAVGFWSGETRTLRRDFIALRPTIISASQRVCTMIQNTVHRNISNSPLLRRHFFRDGATSPYNNEQSYMHTSRWVDFFVYGRVRQRLGGKLQFICTGGSTLPEATQIYLRKSLNIPILQSYGLTESCAAGMMQLHNDTSTNTVGAPLACVEIKLRSCPELGFLVTDNPPRGEILIRGPCISGGYFKDRNSARFFDEYGFFCSGDIAELNANGNWTIIDRKENFMRLAADEYVVAVGQLEHAYEFHPAIARIWIHASNDHKHLIAIAVVDATGLINFGKENGVQTEDLDNKEVQRALLDSLTLFAERRRMLPYEKIRNIRLLRNDFAEVNPLLETSGRQLRRANLEHHFVEELDEMYAEIGDFSL